VEAARIEHASAARPPHSFLHAYSGLCIQPAANWILRISKIQ
jgi:hypothetical protein